MLVPFVVAVPMPLPASGTTNSGFMWGIQAAAFGPLKTVATAGKTFQTDNLVWDPLVISLCQNQIRM